MMTQSVDSSVKFWNRFAKKYAKKPISDQQAYEKKLALTREYLKPESRVLEFGCGTGGTALLHAPRVKEIIALDSSAKMIEIAEAKAAESEVNNVRFQTGTLFDGDWPPASFDVVLGLNVLHLIADYEASIRRCYELLTDGGVLITSSGCLGEMNLFLRTLLPMVGSTGLIPKVKVFTLKELEAAMTSAGFRILKSVNYNKGNFTRFIVAEK